MMGDEFSGMPWTTTVNALYQFLGGKRTNGLNKIETKFSEFSDFIFSEVGGNQGLLGWESRAGLEGHVKTLAKMGYLSYEQKSGKMTLDSEQIKTLQGIWERSRADPMSISIPLFGAYLDRLEDAGRAKLQRLKT